LFSVSINQNIVSITVNKRLSSYYLSKTQEEINGYLNDVYTDLYFSGTQGGNNSQNNPELAPGRYYIINVEEINSGVTGQIWFDITGVGATSMALNQEILEI
jgi:hypothetical protein